MLFQPRINMEDCWCISSNMRIRYNESRRSSDSCFVPELNKVNMNSEPFKGKEIGNECACEHPANGKSYRLKLQLQWKELREISWSIKCHLVIITGWYTVKKVNRGGRNIYIYKRKKIQWRLFQCAGLEEDRFAGGTSDCWNIRLVSKFKAMFVPGGRFPNIILGFQALKTVCINKKRSPLHFAIAS